MTMIRSKVRHASVDHACDFCGCKIAKGEEYEYQVHVLDGLPYSWLTHIHCQKLCDKLWDYADPDECGMSSDRFLDAVHESMAVFFCPYHCTNYDVHLHGCRVDFDEDFCIRQFARFMENKLFYLTLDDNGILCWKLTEAKDATQKA